MLWHLCGEDVTSPISLSFVWSRPFIPPQRLRQRTHNTTLILPVSPACSVPSPGPAAPGCAGSVSAWPQTRPLTSPAAWPWWWSAAPAFLSPSSAPRSLYCSFPYRTTWNCPSPLCRPVLGPADPAINSDPCTTTLGRETTEGSHDLKCQRGEGGGGGEGGLLVQKPSSWAVWWFGLPAKRWECFSTFNLK